MGQRQVRADRLSGHHLLLGAQATRPRSKSLDEVDPEIRCERSRSSAFRSRNRSCSSGVAVDAVFDSVSVATTFKEKLAELGIIFCSFSEAVQNHPELVRKYLGTVVPYSDNFFATLNSAVFSDGSFAYIPKGVRCPMELSTYFRINAQETGQFERTLIIAEEGAYVSYLEGCTAPMRDENQLHAAVVELVALDNATIKYSTVQNWYPGDKEGKGGIYNFVTKRGTCRGRELEDHVDAGRDRIGDHVEISRAASCMGDNSVGEFYSVAHDQQLPAGRHRHEDDSPREEHEEHDRVERHLGRPRPEHLSRAGARSRRARGRAQLLAVRFAADRRSVRRAHVPVSGNQEQHRPVEHEASTSKIGEDQIFYCRQRGISTEDAVNMIVNGFCKEVFRSCRWSSPSKRRSS